ncbi:MAG TPA: amidohydrolase [Pirellulaceae bacterium]|nr:amidohydrolase [Pirellulaceae bacterium]
MDSRNRSRRTFLWQGALTAGGVACLPVLGRAQEPPVEVDGGPDLVVINAKIYTQEERQPRAEALAVTGDRLLAVGSTERIKALATKRTRVIDAEGMTLVPGFIDAHTHPADSGVSELMFVDCNRPAVAEIQAAMRGRAAKTPAGEWVAGFKFDDTKLKDGPLTRTHLDAAAPDHPARVLHRGGHTAIVNSAAFKQLGITKDTPDPEGGKFGRGSDGELTGFVAETALKVVDRGTRTPAVGPRERQAGVKLISEMMTAAGLTTVHDAQASKDDFQAYQDALAAGQMLFRTYLLVVPELLADLQRAGVRARMGSDRLRIGGVKLFCDGSASERTMRMSRPYVGRPNDYGILVTTQDKLNDAVLAAHQAGFQVGVHANGDVAIDMVLTAYELAQRLAPREGTRHRIEHCTLVNPELLKRIAAAGVIPTPFYTYVYYHGDKWAQYGDERVRWMFAHRSFLDHGIRVAGASDYVPGPFEPLMAIQSMVTRTDYAGRVWGENQRISVAEALQICTLHGAYASFEERHKGSLAAGKLADFVLLEGDPHEVDPGRIKDIRVARTVVGGQTVHPAAESGGRQTR